MAFDFNLEKVKESLVNAGKEVENMAKDVSTVAKIKIDIHNKEVFLEKQYALLGKAYYEAHKDEDVEESVYFPSITEALVDIAQLKADLLAAQGGRARKGNGRNFKLGEPGCEENTVVGAIAKYRGRKAGESVFDPVFLIAAVLEWAGIAKNSRGELILNRQT